MGRAVAGARRTSRLGEVRELEKETNRLSRKCSCPRAELLLLAIQFFLAVDAVFESWVGEETRFCDFIPTFAADAVCAPVDSLDSFPNPNTLPTSAGNKGIVDFAGSSLRGVVRRLLEGRGYQVVFVCFGTRIFSKLLIELFPRLY